MLKVTAKKNKTNLGLGRRKEGSFYPSCPSQQIEPSSQNQAVLSVLSVLVNRAILTNSSRFSKLIKWSNHRNSSNSCNSQSSVILSCYSLLFLCYPVFSYPVTAPVTFLFPLLFCLLLPCHLPLVTPLRFSVTLSSLTLSPLILSLLGYSVYRIVLTIRKGNEKQDNSVYYC